MALTDQDQTRLALAGLFVALARTLGEKDKSFPMLFNANIQRVYREMEGYPTPPLGALETLRAANALLRPRTI